MYKSKFKYNRFIYILFFMCYAFTFYFFIFFNLRSQISIFILLNNKYFVKLYELNDKIKLNNRTLKLFITRAR